MLCSPWALLSTCFKTFPTSTFCYYLRKRKITDLDMPSLTCAVSVSVCFFRMIYQKPMQLESSNLTKKCSKMSPKNPFILMKKGQRSSVNWKHIYPGYVEHHSTPLHVDVGAMSWFTYLLSWCSEQATQTPVSMEKSPTRCRRAPSSCTGTCWACTHGPASCRSWSR